MNKSAPYHAESTEEDSESIHRVIQIYLRIQRNIIFFKLSLLVADFQVEY